MSFGSKDGKDMHFPGYNAGFRYFHLEYNPKCSEIALVWGLLPLTGVVVHFTGFLKIRCQKKVVYTIICQI